MNTVLLTILVISIIALALILMSTLLIIKDTIKQYKCKKCGNVHTVYNKKCTKCGNKMGVPTAYRTLLFGKINCKNEEGQLIKKKQLMFEFIDIGILAVLIVICSIILSRLV